MYYPLNCSGEAGISFPVIDNCIGLIVAVGHSISWGVVHKRCLAGPRSQ